MTARLTKGGKSANGDVWNAPSSSGSPSLERQANRNRQIRRFAPGRYAYGENGGEYCNYLDLLAEGGSACRPTRFRTQEWEEDEGIAELFLASVSLEEALAEWTEAHALELEREAKLKEKSRRDWARRKQKQQLDWEYQRRRSRALAAAEVAKAEASIKEYARRLLKIYDKLGL